MDNLYLIFHKALLKFSKNQHINHLIYQLMIYQYINHKLKIKMIFLNNGLIYKVRDLVFGMNSK